MQIGTNYNLASAQIKVTPKAKETVSSEQVVFGDNTIDNTLAMADQLKNMKSVDVGSLETAGVLIGAVGGGLVMGVGTAVALNVAGTVGPWPTIGMSLLGGAVGIVTGGTFTSIGLSTIYNHIG